MPINRFVYYANFAAKYPYFILLFPPSCQVFSRRSVGSIRGRRWSHQSLGSSSREIDEGDDWSLGRRQHTRVPSLGMSAGFRKRRQNDSLLGRGEVWTRQRLRTRCWQCQMHPFLSRDGRWDGVLVLCGIKNIFWWSSSPYLLVLKTMST